MATVTETGPAQPANDYAATINWGDGTTTAGCVNPLGHVWDTGAHVYTDTQDHTLTVTAYDQGERAGCSLRDG